MAASAASKAKTTDVPFLPFHRASIDTDDIQSVLEGRTVGQSIDAEFLRGGESRTAHIVIGERPRRS